MRVKNWFKLKVIAAVLLVAFSGIYAGVLLHSIKDGVSAVELDPRTVGINFQLAKTTRSVNGYNASTNEFGYVATNGSTEHYLTARTETNTNSHLLPNQILNGDYVMLNNYRLEQAYINGVTGVLNADNIYVGFGSPYQEVVGDLQSGEVYGDRGLLVDITNIDARLNGQRIQVNNIIGQNDSDGDSQIPELGSIPADYWYDYIDLKNILPFTGGSGEGDRIENTEGLYSFTFTYNYITKNQNGYNVEEVNRTYTVSFYLLNQTSYAQEFGYPNFNNAPVQGNPDTTTNVLNYFYNFNTGSLPQLTFDASRYNISVHKTKDNLTETITSTFNVVNNVFKITYNSTVNGTQTIDVQPNSNGQYLTSFTFSELGDYTITVKYVVKNSNGQTTNFNIIPHSNGLMPYDLNALSSGNNPYENVAPASPIWQKSKLQLHVFGVKSYFIKNNQTLDFEDGSIKADHSSKLPFNSGDEINNTVKPGYYNSIIGTADANLFPETNLPPVFFDYYGSYLFNGNVPNSKIYRYATKEHFENGTNYTMQYATKDSQITSSGYYEVVFNYTYPKYVVGANGSNTPHYQVFFFRITSTTTSVQIHTTDSTIHNPAGANADPVLQSSQFTNKNVYGKWHTQNYFTADITAKLEHRTFSGQLVSETNFGVQDLVRVGNFTATPLPTVMQNGKYTLTVFYSENRNLYVTSEFIVDSTPIADVQIEGIEKLSTNQSQNYYIVNNPNIVDLQNKTMLNQPFTLTYSQKESGAKIFTTYYKVPFTTNLNGGLMVNDSHIIESNYIQALSAINYGQITTKLDYNLDFNMLGNGEVSFANAFVDEQSFIYLFNIQDEAGNIVSKNVVYDLTTPQVIVEPHPNNPYNVVSQKTTVSWGTHKAVPVLNSQSILPNGNNGIAQFKAFLENNSLFTKLTDDNYYLLSPITSANFSSITTGQTHNFVRDVNFEASVDFMPDFVQGNFFSGEGSFVYNIADQSHIPSNTTIANNNTYNSNIWMNHDNSIAIAYGAKAHENSGTTYGEAINWYAPGAKSTNAEQVRATYLPGDIGTSYHVKSFTYTYYEKAVTDYTDLSEALSTTYVRDVANNETASFYPYSATPLIVNQPVAIDLATKIQGMSDDANKRVVSTVINAVEENGQTVTMPGLYIFRREYNAQEDGDYAKDSVVRYYALVVNREQNINIEGQDVLDEDIEAFAAKDSSNNYTYPLNENSILYQTGSGVYFKFTPSASDQTRMSARQLQNFMEQTGNTNLFTSNKLPVKINLPDFKYNDKFTLSLAKNYNQHSATVQKFINDNTHPLYYQIEYFDRADRRILIADTLNSSINGTKFDLNYVGRQAQAGNGRVLAINPITQATQVELKHQGTYTITLFSNKSVELNPATRQHSETRMSFNIIIDHEAPTGKYMVLGQDNAKREVEQDSVFEQTTRFVSTNSQSLMFEFEDSRDDYKARIDSGNLRVLRKTKAGAETPIFVRTNGSNAYPSIPAGTPVPTVFLTPEVIDPIKNLKRYTLDLTYFANQSATADLAVYTVELNYVGNEADFIIDGQNFFKRKFEVVLDRIKPQHNLQQLQTKDSTKFNVSQVSGINTTNYFFAINKDFRFESNAALGQIGSTNYGAKLDSYELYIRRLEVDASTGYPVNYLYSITPDNPNYTNPAYSDHPKFSESSAGYTRRDYGGGSFRVAEELFEVNNGKPNYYEIVERDEAGNYQVYAVQYIDTQITPQFSLKYKLIGKEAEDYTLPAQLVDEQNNNVVVNGTQLKLDSIITNDYFLKVIITDNNTLTTTSIANNPNLDAVNANVQDFINRIHSAINYTNTKNQSGYHLTLTFVNRFRENYVVNYYVAGDVLQPVFSVKSPTSFTITIPKNNASTQITQFRVWRFVDGAWSATHEFVDSLGKPIRIGQPNGPSLQNDTYTFTSGEYMFQLVDNFNRGSKVPEEAYYYGVGTVNNVNTMVYGQTSVNANGTNYTQGPSLLSYQTQLYELTIYKYQLNEETGVWEKVLVTDLANENITSQVNNTTSVRTLTFTLPGNNVEKRYVASLYFRRLNTRTEYDFTIIKKLPNIQLSTVSGSVVSHESSPFTENIVISWPNELLDFNPTVSLTRVYTNTNGVVTTETLNNIPNGYIVSEQGQYTARITNALGYTHTSKNISFQIIEGNVNVFSVITKDQTMHYVANESPTTSLYTDNLGFAHLVHQYYIFEKYNTISGSSQFSYELVLNSTKSLSKNIVEENEHSHIWLVEGVGVRAYVEVVFVPEELAGSNFVDLNINAIKFNNDGSDSEPELMALNHTITTNAKSLTLDWKAFNDNAQSSTSRSDGNKIVASYKYNGQLVQHIYNYLGEKIEFTIDNAGVHEFEFYDLSGNRLTVSGQQKITINLINGLIYKVNDQEPLPNIIVNNYLKFEIITINPITQARLYSGDILVTALRDGQPFEARRLGNTYVYEFTTQGYYELTITTSIMVGTESRFISSNYSFTIVSTTQILKAFDIPSNFGFTIDRILHLGTEIAIENPDTLWLSTDNDQTQPGRYDIYLRGYVPNQKTERLINFTVFINDQEPELRANIPFGTSTTGTITIYYNPLIINEILGDSILRITNANNPTMFIEFAIDSSAEAGEQKVDIVQNGTYWVEILTKDGKLAASYKVIKAEPLNTTAVIVISIGSALAVILAVVFIILRRRVKFR